MLAKKEKMRYFLLLFLLCFYLNSFSQGTQLGINAGFSQSRVNHEYHPNTAGLEDFGLGPVIFSYYSLNVTVWNSRHVNFRPSVSLLQKGFKDSLLVYNNGIGEVDVVSERIRYIATSADMLFKYPAGKFEPYLLVGPRVDFLVSDRFILNETDLNSGFPSNDFLFGINGGIGISYKLTELLSINAEAVNRWMTGSVFKPTHMLRRVYHDCYTVSAGLAYRFVKKTPETAAPAQAH